MTMPDPVSPSGSSLKSKSEALVLGAERGAVRGPAPRDVLWVPIWLPVTTPSSGERKKSLQINLEAE